MKGLLTCRCSSNVIAKIPSLLFFMTLSLSATADTLKLKAVKIMDPTGFASPLWASSSLIPADWVSEGGVIWNINGDCSGGPQMQWSAKTSDGKASIGIYPTVGWRMSSMAIPVPQDCLNANFNSSDEFLSAYTSSLEDGKVVDVQRNPDVMKMVSAMNSEFHGDPYSKFWGDAASVTVEYTLESVPQMSVVNIMTFHSYTKSGHTMGMGPPLEMAYGAAYFMVEFAAPKSEFINWVPSFLAFERNYRINPEWQARINKMNRRMSKDNLETSRKISQINSKASQEISAMSMDSWRKKQASDNYLSRETTEAIFGEETYSADTPSGQISLPFGYDQAWQLDDGSFVVTDDRFFEPTKDAGQGGSLLKPLP
ncbi:MAG: hypothetical protein KTR32_16795 [Granulosicoccus sp.]|nr:hypothetical protein [Granulosicoccus sp.]